MCQVWLDLITYSYILIDRDTEVNENVQKVLNVTMSTSMFIMKLY